MAIVRKTGALPQNEHDQIKKDLDQVQKMTRDDYIGGPIKSILDGQEMARKRTEQFLDDIGYKKK
jgi:hypothetical protein